MNVGDAVFWVSLSGAGVLALLGYARDRNLRQFVLLIVPLAAYGAAYATFFQSGASLRPKGAHSNELAFILILYGCMLTGMVSHYSYNHLRKSAGARQPFDLGKFLAPVFVSPMVFIPLLGAFQNTDIDLTKLTLPKYMVFFVAFQNGFFWREFFENLRKGKNS